MTSTSNRPQGLTVHALNSEAGKRILARQKIDASLLARAIVDYEATERVRVATCIGVHKRHGFFFSSDPQWRPDSPDAFAEPIGFIPWVHIHEILGRLPSGSTADYLNTNGTLN
jgi:hypothetical protein